MNLFGQSRCSVIFLGPIRNRMIVFVSRDATMRKINRRIHVCFLAHRPKVGVLINCRRICFWRNAYFCARFRSSPSSFSLTIERLRIIYIHTVSVFFFRLLFTLLEWGGTTFVSINIDVDGCV